MLEETQGAWADAYNDVSGAPDAAAAALLYTAITERTESADYDAGEGRLVA